MVASLGMHVQSSAYDINMCVCCTHTHTHMHTVRKIITVLRTVRFSKISFLNKLCRFYKSYVMNSLRILMSPSSRLVIISLKL
jgi:hypothetical protein